MKSLRSCVAAIAALLAAAQQMLLYAQCAICQASLANAENSSRIAAGFKQGIALMFAVMALLGLIGWRMVRRARNEFETGNSQDRSTETALSSCVPAENPASR